MLARRASPSQQADKKRSLQCRHEWNGARCDALTYGQSSHSGFARLHTHETWHGEPQYRERRSSSASRVSIASYSNRHNEVGPQL